jgi:cytosine/adenosine deaminase-related metal-dependent hydrolase
MTLLIRGGIVIDTDPVPAVTGHTDVLIDDGRIVEVGTGLSGDEVIDATGRIVLPGFVDPHRHTWQAAIRAIGPDISFAGYFQRVIGELAPRYRPEDVYAGNLAGALECLDAGITTMLDWSHIQRTPAHTEAAIRALRESGVRAVFGYCQGPETFETAVRRVRREYFDRPDPLLSMALAARGPEIGDEEGALREWRLARELGLPVTTHMGGHGPESAERGLAFLTENDLLDPGTTYIHPIHYTDDALKRLADSGGTASYSPIVEVELGIGHPAPSRALAAGMPVSLSADTVASGPGDMFSLMRAAYALERTRGAEFTTRDALRMATLGGAEVMGLADVTGSLTPGKQADLVLLRADTPAMAPAHDPVGAVVLSAGTSAVDTVLVGGRIVKRDGRLLADLAGPMTALAEAAKRLTAPC